MGLGLCISKRLSEALGCDIEVRSEPGKGSSFSVTIDPGPLEGICMVQAGQAPSIVAPMTEDKIELHGRILLAEDELKNQRLICLLLRKAGADVTAVENGQLAVDAALAAREMGKPFDVILMDMQMPVLDGYQAMRQLRSLDYTGPIVALTAYTTAPDRQKCLDAGCNDYLAKPIERRILIETVARHIAAQKVDQPRIPNHVQPSAANVPSSNASPDSLPGESNSSTALHAPFVYSHLADDPDLGELLNLFVQEMPDWINAF